MIAGMVIIHPAINLLLWVIYVISAMTCLSFALPCLGGGWDILNFEGKITCIGSGLIAIASFWVLMTTVVLPL